ncbi:putative short-chain dehydrogenase reductase sdr [Diplodia seriata]|uniref:Putative short-chain dehydrogenase reductase sdr n=1 Tax=Diplodia seriata TaxID=420778 RepID=A0A0G2EPJ6_9PEZI|nr:putative short-chain dehydrogenase reductase sdr [Diplodia seriata]
MASDSSEAPMHYLVTGAARGIGRGLARSLLSKGHRVFLLDSNKPELENTLSLASSWAKPSSSSSSPSPAFKGRVVDLADRAQLKSAVAEASTFFEDRLDVLVNNAFATPHTWSGGRRMDDADDAVEREWDVKLAVGLTAPFLLARLCVPMLARAKTGEPGQQGRPAGGSIVNVASTRAHQAEPNHEAYSAAKAGLLGLTRSMAVSLGEAHGIRVNAVTPGWIDVDDENAAADAKGAGWGEALGEADHAWHPAGRVGRVDDIARAVVFLAESGFVTGEEIVVDGGVTKKMVYPEE